MAQPPTKLECSAEFINPFVSEWRVSEDFFVEDNRRVFSVEVYHITEADLEPPVRPSTNSTNPLLVTNLEELLAILQDKLRLWLTPYIVVSFRRDPSYDYAVFKDRGLRYRAWLQKKRLDQVFDQILRKYRRHLEIKSLKRNLGKTRHIVMTITLDPKRHTLQEAYRYIPRRLKQVREYIRRHYGLLAYVAVLEVHESGYPHFHVLFITKASLRVFKHKNIWRFTYKRVWEKDLNATSGDFIDAFALHSLGVKDYFKKYAGKFLDPDIFTNGKELNVKSLALPIARLFRIRVLYTNVRTPRPQKKTIPFLNDAISIGKLIEQYNKARDLKLKATLHLEIRQRIIDLLIKYKQLPNDLIDHISRIGDVMDPQLGEITQKRLEEKIAFYWRICYNHYVFSFRVTLVLGYRYSLTGISVASE